MFPFGRPVVPCVPVATGPRALFVLGAYPSALHVRWRPPQHARSRVLAVDNEPEPFWTGVDEVVRVDAWVDTVGWRDEWGSVTPAGTLNGSSGRWVETEVLGRLHVTRSQAWITDCLDTHHASTGMKAVIREVYDPFAASHGLPLAGLSPHPDEERIVTDAVTAHLPRLRLELAAASPSCMVTLGNAALRVFRALLAEPVGPTKLSPRSYGSALPVQLGDREIVWLPLAHPAAPDVYQEAHRAWRPAFTCT